MVGDREHDVLGAKEVGISSLGVLYGYGSEAELKNAGADHIVHTPAEIVCRIS
jgi:phosphoglycolate phosphatase